MINALLCEKQTIISFDNKYGIHQKVKNKIRA